MHEDLVPFSEFTLHPGEDRYLVLNVRLPPCSALAPGTGVVLGTFDVRYSVLVFDHHQRISLRDPERFARGRHAARDLSGRAHPEMIGLS